MFPFTSIVYMLRLIMLTSPDKFRRFLTAAKWGAIAALAVLLLLETWLSLEWRMVQDSPLLHYVAFVID